MIDVFVKVWCDTPLRLGLAMAVVERLKMFPNARLHVLCAKDTLHFAEWTEDKNFLWCDKEKFWITTKAYAEQAAKSDIYVVIDDDHLPIGKDWLSGGAIALNTDPEFGMACSWSVNGEVPEDRSGMDPIWSSDSIGCPYFIRRGILGDADHSPRGIRSPRGASICELPAGHLTNYDTMLTQHVQSKGWKTGFLRNVRHNHLGMSYSQVIPGHWSAAVA